ncbi:hypothetical protein F0521_15170 [Ferrimonas sp. YFM]|nr:hypothetical protein F0521_15170 [Ferrimonas sp. YFM]
MWNKTIPKRALRISCLFTVLVSLIALTRVVMGPSWEPTTELITRFAVLVPSLFLIFWAFFCIYLYLSPDADGFLNRRGHH